MSKHQKKKKHDEDDWIYDPLVVKGILKTRKELHESLKKGKHLSTLEEVIEKFQKENAKKIHN